MAAVTNDRPSLLDFAGKWLNTTSVKVSLLVIGLLFVGRVVATYLLHVNAMATCMLVGIGGFLTGLTFLKWVHRDCDSKKVKGSESALLKSKRAHRRDNSIDYVRDGSPSKLQANPSNGSTVSVNALLGIREKSSTYRFLKREPKYVSWENLSISEGDVSFFTVSEDEKTPPIRIKNPEDQLERFQALPKTGDRLGKRTLQCDAFLNNFPSNRARILLKNGISTNGAVVNGSSVGKDLVGEDIIVIQGPHNQKHKELMWDIVIQEEIGAIVRLGPIVGYQSYTPIQGTTQNYGDISVFGLSEHRQVYGSITRTDYLLTHSRKTRTFPIYAMEGWNDFQTHSLEGVYRLIIELEKIKELILIHCRAGLGRSGVFVICRQIYQLLKKAQQENMDLEVDLPRLVEEMRSARPGAVQNDDQFMMIAGFVDYLNTKHSKV